MESQQLHQNPHSLHGSAYASVTSKEVPSNQDPLAVSASNLPEFDRDSTKIENHQETTPKVETLYRIAKGLRISKDEILHIAGITSHTSPKHPNSVDLGKQFADDDLLLSFEGKPLSPE